MKTQVLARTYDPSDCVSVGWSIEWHGGRLMAERRSRWQGSIDGVRILLGRRMPLDVAKMEASLLDGEKLDSIRHRLEAGHSVTAVWPSGAGDAKVTNYGHAVR
jgi:hypothetical protein